MGDESHLGQDAEALLETFSTIAECVRSDPDARFLIFDGEEITGESAEWPVAMLLLAPGAAWMETKTRIIEYGLAEVLVAWQATEHFYLTGRDDVRKGATGRQLVEFMTSRRHYAEALVEMRGGGQVRTPDELLSESPAFAEALAEWEGHNDSLVAEVRKDWVARILAAAPAARAKLRWGTLPDRPPGEEGDDLAERLAKARMKIGT
jgi:hypothetical protein